MRKTTLEGYSLSAQPLPTSDGTPARLLVLTALDESEMLMIGMNQEVADDLADALRGSGIEVVREFPERPSLA